MLRKISPHQTNEKKGEAKAMKKSVRFVLPGLLALSLVFGVKSAHAAAGSLDQSFGKGGKVTTSFNSNVFVADAVLQADGKIVVIATIGGNFGVVRYLSTGILDTTFGHNGVAQAAPGNGESSAASVALQADGKIVVAGTASTIEGGVTTPEFAVVRFNPDGSLDTTFGAGGQVTTGLGFPNVGEAVLIEPDGKILLGGTLEPVGRGQPFRTALARFNSDGSLDATFGKGGTVVVAAIGGVTTLAEDAAGNIFALNGNLIAEFSPAGSLDSTITAAEITVSSQGGADSFQSNGGYLFAEEVAIGAARNKDDDTQVVRFTATGQVDSTFNSPIFDFSGEGGSSNLDVSGAIAIQSNGQIVVGGGHSHNFANNLFALARLNPGGTLDSTFGTGGVVTTNLGGNDSVNAVIIQSDGKIVAIGGAGNFNELALARYLAQ